jgi:hypothetical protein
VSVIKQYVNLGYNKDKHHGSQVHFEVQASNLTEADVKRAEWWVEPEGGDNTPSRYLSHASRARMKRKVTGNQKDRFRNTIYLPHVGGDKYKIKCSKYKDRSNPHALDDVFQTWRKIFFTVHYMNDDCKRFYNNVKARFKAAFEEAFIELEEVTVNNTLKDEPQTRSTNVLSHLYRKRPRLSNRPFHLRIVVLNDIGSVVGSRYTQKGISTKQWTKNTDKDLCIVRGYSWRKSAKARVEPRGRWYNINAHTTKSGKREIKIDLRTHKRLSEAIDTGKTIEIRLRTREFRAYCGHSIGNFCCVRINEPGTDAQTQKTILQTFAHELGHGLRQAVRRERTYNDRGRPTGWEKNALWHTNKYGGQGPHCFKNAKLVASRKTTSGKIYTHDSGTLCTMFFRADANVDADGKFCDSCLPRLKRVNIGASAMRRQGWNLV